MLSASSNIVFCRCIHQITAYALYIKKVEAYKKYVSTSTDHLERNVTTIADS